MVTETVSLALILAFVVLVLTVRGKNREAGLWITLAILGQAAALQLIFAGPTIHYQHFLLGLDLVQPPYRNFLLILMIQALLVAWGIHRRWQEIFGSVFSTIKPWQLVLLISIFFVSSASLSRNFGFYLVEVLFAGSVQLINLAAVLLGVFSIPHLEIQRINLWLEHLLGKVDDTQRELHPKAGKFGIIIATLVFVITAGLNYFVYERHPHVQDEVLYLYQARYFSQGMVTTPAPPAPDGFSIYMIPFKSDTWYSPFPPGWPALLSIGMLLKVGWLVNPFLAGINILLANLLFQAFFSVRYARLSSLLLLASPWFLFMGMNFMSHTFMLTCALAAGWAAVSFYAQKKLIWSFLSGVFIGILFLIRPMDGLVIGGLLGLALIFITDGSLRVKSMLAYLLGGILLGALMLPYNQQVTGDPFTLPLNRYYLDYYGPKTYALGFGQDRGINWAIDPLPGYSPVEAVLNAALNTFSVNIELFGWSSGSLFLAAFFLVCGYPRMNRLDYFFLAVIIGTIGAYALFWFSGGPDFGARYWYLLIFPLIYFSVRAVLIIEQPVDNFLGTNWGQRIVITAVVLSIMAFLIYIPWRAADKYNNYLEMKPDILALSKANKFNRSLVLIQGRSHPDYESAWIYNPLDFTSAETIYAYDRDPETRREILAAFADRSIWFLKGPSLTGDTYHIIAGPLTAQEALQIPR